MHQWLFDHRILVLLLCLPAMAWSGFLYLRAYRNLQAGSQKPRRRRTALRPKPPGKEPGATSLQPGPLPRTTSIKGEQSDLLEAMDDQSTVGDSAHQVKAYQSTHIIRPPANRLVPPRDTGPRPSEIIRQLQDREPAKEILDQIEAAADEKDADEKDEGFSTTDKFRTTRHLQAIHEAETPAWLDEQGELHDQPVEPPPGLTPAQREAWRSDQQRLKDLAEEARRTSAPLPQEPGSDRAIHRGYIPPSQAAISAMEKAKRLEELGLHIGISKADIAKAAAVDAQTLREVSEITNDLSDEQRQRLSELGLSEDDSSKRLITAELDSILSRLDAALDSDDQPTPVNDDAQEGQDNDPGLDAVLDQVLGDDDDQAIIPAKPVVDLPAWARADTFDEDQKKTRDASDDDSGKQQSLFE
jgi:hypothetical protein